MDKSLKIQALKDSIDTAIDDYWKHSKLNEDEIKENVSYNFIDTLAEDAYYAKYNLRNMLRKSPNWNEELDAVVLNGTSTHDLNYEKIYRMAVRIVEHALDKAEEAGVKARVKITFFVVQLS